MDRNRGDVSGGGVFFSFPLYFRLLLLGFCSEDGNSRGLRARQPFAPFSPGAMVTEHVMTWRAMHERERCTGEEGKRAMHGRKRRGGSLPGITVR